VVGHSPANCWRLSIVDLLIPYARARVKDADWLTGITWGLVLRREDSVDRTRPVRTISRWRHLRRHGHEDTFTPIVSPLRGIVARWQTQRYVDLFFSIGVRCCYGFAEWRMKWCDLVSTAVDDFGEWFCAVIVILNESISPWFNEWEFMFCLALFEMSKRGHGKTYLRHAFSVTTCCCPIKIHYVTAMMYAKNEDCVQSFA